MNEISNTPVHGTPPPLIEVYGTHREMGRQIGEARRAQIEHSIANAHILIDQSYSQLELTWEGAQIQSRKYLPFAEERYPQYMDELRGIAEGANVSFDDVVVLNAMEAMTMDALHLTRCTSMAVNEERTADGHVLAAHNEDWMPEDEDDVYVVSAKPRGEPPFLAMTYGGLLPNVGFNAFGIAQLIESDGFAHRYSAPRGGARCPRGETHFRRDRACHRPSPRGGTQPPYVHTSLWRTQCHAGQSDAALLPCHLSARSTARLRRRASAGADAIQCPAEAGLCESGGPDVDRGKESDFGFAQPEVGQQNRAACVEYVHHQMTDGHGGEEGVEEQDIAIYD